MPKKKKTRKQKQLADVRRQTEPTVSHTATIQRDHPVREEHETASTIQSLHSQKPVMARSVVTTDYHYLTHDLRKTVILTALILAAQIIIKQVTGV